MSIVTKISKLIFLSECVWALGIIFGISLIRIPVVGMTLLSYSVLMLTFVLRSDEKRSLRLYKSGMRQLECREYSQAYRTLSRAYEFNSENPDLILALVKSNILSCADLAQARMHIYELDENWRDCVDNNELSKLRILLEESAVSGG